MEVIDVAKEEIKTRNKIWEYYYHPEIEQEQQNIDDEDDATINVHLVNTGTHVEFFNNQEENLYKYRVFSRMKD